MPRLSPLRPVIVIRQAKLFGRWECCRSVRPQISRLRFHRLAAIFSPTSSASARSRRKSAPPTTRPRLFPRRSFRAGGHQRRTSQPDASNAAATRRSTVTVTGTPPVSIQWSLDNLPVAGATNTSFSLTNLHLPNHIGRRHRHQSFRRRDQQCRGHGY